MTVDDIIKRVTKIVTISGDDEEAHIAEDVLYQDVLKAIANGSAVDPAACAAAALKTLDIDFARWCA